MISENTKQFILENISKKEFLSKEFLQELKEVILFYDNLNIFFSGFNIYNNLFSYRTGYYNKNDMSINICRESSIKAYENFTLITGTNQNDIINRNIFILHELLHELTHAYQRLLVHTSNTWDDLITHSLLVAEGKISTLKRYPEFLKSKLSSLDYYITHDIFPMELHAEGNSISIGKDIINNLDKKYMNYTYFAISYLMGLYKIKEEKIISTMERFYKKYNIGILYKDMDFSTFTDKELVLYGITNDKEIINHTLNEFLETKSDSDFTFLIRKL